MCVCLTTVCVESTWHHKAIKMGLGICLGLAIKEEWRKSIDDVLVAFPQRPDNLIRESSPSSSSFGPLLFLFTFRLSSRLISLCCVVQGFLILSLNYDLRSYRDKFDVINSSQSFSNSDPSYFSRETRTTADICRQAREGDETRGEKVF